MARNSKPNNKSAKTPGRLKQMWQVFNVTRKQDSLLIPLMLVALVLPIVVGILLALFVSDGNWFTAVIWILLGVVTGILLGMIVLGRRAETMAYRQIEGKPGAVGAVLQTALKRGWRGTETPVAVNPRTQDAIYRAVSRRGVLLVAEGPKNRTKRLLQDEEKKVHRVAPNVKITVVHVGPDADSVPIAKLNRAIRKGKGVLRSAEVSAVANRLDSLDAGFGIPKGVDPRNVRPDHKAMRGR